MTAPQKPIIERAPIVEHKVHEHPIINRILQNRGVISMDEMEYSLSQLIDPFTMTNMREAVILLEQHLRKNSRMVVVGDFDCDGATSTSVAVAGLKMMGATKISFIIPDRVIHGYGLTPSIVKLAEELEPDLIITVDNGIASFEGAQAIRDMKRPCQLLVTDHHLAAEKGLPCADQIVNPNQPGCTFPSKNLAGCGVMFYVIMALRAQLRDTGYFEERLMTQPNIGTLLDLVALGTVADVVPLDKNNRILIDAGLSRIRAGHGRPGIRALLEIAKRNPEKVVASDMGFSLGPRINAAGRLDDMSMGINCLLSESYEEAMEIATRLDELNQQRRDIEADHVIDAALLIEENDLESKKGVVLFDNTWHPGVVGIVSSRVKDRLNRPVICMTDADSAKKKRAQLNLLISQSAPQSAIDKCKAELQDCEVKGSARSIDGIHLKHVLDHIYKTHPDILTKFGGHAMAAGLSLKYKYLDLFMSLFDAEVAKDITEEQMLGSITVDMKFVDASVVSMDLADQIRHLGPWGQFFPEPNFHARFHSISAPKIMKEKHAKFTVTMEGSDQVFEAVAFNIVKDGELPVGDVFDAAFSLDINEYRGKRTLQLMLREVQLPEMQMALAINKPEAMTKERSEAVSGSAQPAKSSDLLSDQEATTTQVRTDSTRIKGAGAAPQSSAPVTKKRAALDAALEAIRATGARTRFVPRVDDPSPF